MKTKRQTEHFSNSVDEHLVHLEGVFRKLREINVFFRKNVVLLNKKLNILTI